MDKTRIDKKQVAARLAERMGADEETSTQWREATLEVVYEAIASGESVTLPGFGGFYVRPESDTWVFRFNPSQRLRAAFGWSSTYKGN
jgi:DNA-binding protein HU-beta